MIINYKRRLLKRKRHERRRTFLRRKENEMIKANEVTLFSGGAKGAETVFGECAAAHGLTEVNFTFDGHHLNRNVGTVFLSQDDLAKSDMIMSEVSRRINRDYSSRPWMRGILQSICHQVNKGYQVFVVGTIQADQTVKGGTGWAAELAKLFNRPLAVYDQELKEWFAWHGGAWIKEEPFIMHYNICGTGTRHLNAEGEAAIRDLFARSFKG